MNTQEAKAKLHRLIRARAPIIGVETSETRRFIESLVDIIDTDENQQRRNGKREAVRKQLFSFSVTRGLSRIATHTGEFELPLDDSDSPETAPAIIFQELPLIPALSDPNVSAYAITQTILENDAPTDDLPHGPARLYVMKDIHPYFDDPMVVRGLRDLAEVLIKRHQTVILVSPDLSSLPPVLHKDVKILTWPLPGDDELEEQIDSFCVNLEPDQNRLNGNKGGLVEALRGLTMIEADQVLAEAVIANGYLDEQAVAFVIEAKAEIIKQSGALEFYPPEVELGDVGGLENLQRWLMMAGRTNTAEARQFGIKPARGVLVVGVPGCGKSLTAKAISKLWGVPLLRLDAGALFGGLVGQSESQTRNALRIASAIGKAVLWIDEIEKGLSSQGGEHDGGTSKRVLGTILTWMEEHATNTFIFATANDIAQLRPELVRRFTEVFFVDLPSPSERRTILQIHLRKAGRDPESFDLEQTVDLTENFTGAEIEETVQSALWAAFSESGEVTSRHLEVAAKQTVPLVTTMAEQIQAMRQWATRARPASDHQSTGRALHHDSGARTRAGALELG